MEIQYLWVQEMVRSKRVTLVKVKGTENLPDIGTKHLPVADFERYRRRLGLVPLAEIVPDRIIAGRRVADALTGVSTDGIFRLADLD